jgi:hypothetical protein
MKFLNLLRTHSTLYELAFRNECRTPRRATWKNPKTEKSNRYLDGKCQCVPYETSI